MAPPVAQASACGIPDAESESSNFTDDASDGAGSLPGTGRERVTESHRLPFLGQGKKPVLQGAILEPSVPIDLLFDNHVVELEECRRWANSDAGQVARIENPAGFANVRAHAELHLRAIGLAYAGQGTPAKQ